MVTLTADVNVVLLDFKTTKGKEMVATNEDGSYTIFINSRLSYAVQLKAYQHAMRHIENGDFEKNDVQQIEYVAHNLPVQQPDKRISSIDFEKRLADIRKRRVKIQKQLREYEKKIEVMLAENPIGFYQRLENQRLYGDDL